MTGWYRLSALSVFITAGAFNIGLGIDHQSWAIFAGAGAWTAFWTIVAAERVQ